MEIPEDILRALGDDMSGVRIIAVSTDEMAGIAVIHGITQAGGEIFSSLNTLEKICNLCTVKPELPERYGIDLDVLCRQVLLVYRLLINLISKAIIPLPAEDAPEHLEQMRRDTVAVGDELADDLRQRREAFAERHNL